MGKQKIEILGDMNFLYEEDDVQYELSVLVSTEKSDFGNMDMVSLSFWKNKGMKVEEILEVWDNETYLYEVLFLKVLKPFAEKKIESVNEKGLNDLLKIKGVDVSHLKGLYKLFKKGIKIGMFHALIKTEQND